MSARRQAHARVHGRVQGVGYRYFVLVRAAALDLCGWVRNCRDGSVEVLAEGPEADLASLLESLGRGPAGARVERVDEAWGEARGGLDGFTVRY